MCSSCNKSVHTQVYKVVRLSLSSPTPDSLEDTLPLLSLFIQTYMRILILFLTKMRFYSIPYSIACLFYFIVEIFPRQSI